jgi:hypothetical protein
MNSNSKHDPKTLVQSFKGMVTMQKIGWFVLLALVLSFSPAFAQERLDEMTEIIEEELEEGEERDTFLEGVEDYIEVRDEALSLLVNLVAEVDEDELADEWDDLVEQMQNLPILGDLDDELASEVALELYEQFVDEERAWFLNLGQKNPVTYRDQIVALRIRLAAMTEELEDTWQKQLNDDGQIDEKQLKVMADINTVVVSLAQQSDALRQSLRDKAQAVAEVASSEAVSSSFPGPIGDLLGIMTEAIKYYNTYKTTVESLKPQLKELAGQELGLLVIFNDTREDTQLFVEQNNFDKMKALYGEAEDQIESFADVGTDGQQSDADDFVGEVLAALSEHVSQGQEIFNTFVTKHNLKFFGPIAPEIKESMLETRAWLEESEEVRGVDLQRYLTALRDDINTGGFFGVNLSVDGITDEEREFITSQLKNDLELLRKAIDDNQVVFSNENLSLIYDRRALEDALK